MDPAAFRALAWNTSDREKSAYRKLVSATCTRSPVQVPIVAQAGPRVLVLERREAFQIQAAVGSTGQLDLDDVSFGNPGRLQVVLVDPQGQPVSPSTDLRQHVSTCCIHVPGLTLSLGRAKRRRRGTTRSYLSAWTVPAAYMAKPASLWRHRDFMLLWLGQSVSRLGDQFTGLALPVIAVYILGAGPFENGLLGAAGTLPFLLFGLLVGVWVDRRQRRSVLILADVGRGAIIATIALLGLASLLQLTYLYVFSFFIGILTVFFDVAYQAYLPALVERNQLVDANSKLETTNSIAGTGGPAVAGAVIEGFSAAVAMVFDAASFFFSALTLIAIRKREAVPPPVERRSVLADIREGLHVVFGEPRLRWIAACTAWSNFFSSMIFAALLILYLKNALGFTPFSLGLLFTVASFGGIVGAATSSRIAKRIGVGPSILAGAILFSLPALPLPFVTGPLAFPAIAAMFFVSFVGNLLYNINQVSFRQAIVPVRLQGRLNATMRTIVWGTLPLGAFTGGVLGDLIGVRNAIIVGLVGGAFASLFIMFSPVRRIREMPESVA